MPSGGLEYPGVQGTMAWGFTLSQGITPSTGFIEIPAGVGLPREIGDLEIWYENNRVQLRDCRIGSANYNSSTSGRSITLQIIDRRRKWQFGKISGLYNVRMPDDSIDSETEKSPRELAKLLLEAMGEPSGDYSALPDFSRPEIDWVAANPAQELSSLCESLGCRIALGLDDKVRIVNVGSGQQLPQGGTLQRGDGVAPDERPDALVIIGGPTRYQCELKLEAIGLDVDFGIKPIDELSYKPSGGWGSEWPEVMSGVSDKKITLRDGSKTTAQKLALQTVFRWYRVKDDQKIPEVSGTVSRKRLLPLASTLIDTYRDGDNVKRQKPAYVVGVGWHKELDTYENTADGTRMDISFSVDAEKGILQFGSPVVKLDTSAGTNEPAELRFVVAATVKDEDTFQQLRYEQVRPISRNQSRDSKVQRALRHDEIVLQITGTYDERGRLTGSTDNKDKVEREADYNLDGYVAEYDSPVTDDRTYPGILPIGVDGAIQQVTWSYSASGWTSRASRGTEHSLTRPTFKQLSKIEQLSEPARQARESIIANVKKFLRGGV